MVALQYNKIKMQQQPSRSTSTKFAYLQCTYSNQIYSLTHTSNEVKYEVSCREIQGLVIRTLSTHLQDEILAKLYNNKKLTTDDCQRFCSYYVHLDAEQKQIIRLA